MRLHVYHYFFSLARLMFPSVLKFCRRYKTEWVISNDYYILFGFAFFFVVAVIYIWFLFNHNFFSFNAKSHKRSLYSYWIARFVTNCCVFSPYFIAHIVCGSSFLCLFSSWKQQQQNEQTKRVDTIFVFTKILFDVADDALSSSHLNTWTEYWH